jgi:hypothetical protein
LSLHSADSPSSARNSATSKSCRGGGTCELLHTGDLFR